MVMLLIFQGVKVAVASMFDIDRVVFLGLQILASALIGIGVYLGIAYLLKFEEVRK
jgi:hypothetical protein